jgi:predicted O-methyltransferase YrrM
MAKDYSWQPIWAPTLQESSIHPHCLEEKANFFDAADGGSTEYEILNWLHSSIRLLKPQNILETGGWEGLGTIALAHACKLNGFGKVTCLEIDPRQCVRIEQVLEESHLSQFVEVQCMSSLDYLSQSSKIFDIGFFDSETTIRATEADICLQRGIIRNLAVFHDTSPTRTEEYTPREVQDKYRNDVFALARHPNCTGYYDMPLSRGFIALFLKG